MHMNNFKLNLKLYLHFNIKGISIPFLRPSFLSPPLASVRHTFSMIHISVSSFLPYLLTTTLFQHFVYFWWFGVVKLNAQNLPRLFFLHIFGRGRGCSRLMLIINYYELFEIKSTRRGCGLPSA